jgi:glycogen synthase
MTADAVGGVWTYALELARALAPHGIEVTLATMGPLPDAGQTAVAASIPGLELVTSTFRLEWMDDPWPDVRAAGDWLLALERRVRPLAVHLNGYAHGALDWQSPVMIVGHSCLLSWADAVPSASIDPDKLRAYRRMVTAGIHAADWLVAPTAAMLADLERLYGTAARASVVPNGRSAERFVSRRKEPIVMTAGRLWDVAKNVDAVVAAAPRWPWRVAVAGSQRVPAGGEDRSIAGGVQNLGMLSERDMASWLGRASIFVLPARYEPFGLTPLEAGLAQCALVLGDIPSLREVWGEAATFVGPADQAALREAVADLTASPARLRARQRAAHARALTFTPARMAQAYADIYRTLAASTSDIEVVPCAS